MAAEYAVALDGGEVQCWGDFDGDGWQDLYYVDGRHVHILRNTGGGAFERLPGDQLGLTLPEPAEVSAALFNFAALRLADFDSDGDLDLWVLMFGRDARSNHLFRRDEEGFSDVTEQVGLPGIAKNIFALLCDVDNDGFDDVISNGNWDGEQIRALLWRNQEGKRFVFTELSAIKQARPFRRQPGRERRRAMGPGSDRDRAALLRNISQQNSWVGRRVARW